MINLLLKTLVSIVFLFVITSTNASANYVDTYTFQDPVTEKRFNELNKELRCPKCQNQNLSGSNSPIAQDLRREVYELLDQGKADIEIMNYMVARYGEFVLYRPRVNSLTYILWFAPVVLILIGVLVVVFIVRRKPIARKEVELSLDQQDKLKALLKDKDR
ncbi:MAG: cytochrome c-type biogenesis protein CcmH [Alteromonadaceae bacterium]|jgi:cytochrome c-type biogenesis protein CcmH|tara:strand:- start:1403 stop:1885 length:483 start_codon:yes stop_codon:yes gene_type:complete